VLFSPPRFNYARWMDSPRGEEFREHLDRARALVDGGTPDALFAVTFPVPFISSAGAYLRKYGPDARFDVFEYVPQLGVPVIAFTGDREFENVDFRDHPVEFARAAQRKPDLIHHVVPGGDHYYRGCEGWVVERLLRWMEQAVPTAAP
jgi:hypothetical protein